MEQRMLRVFMELAPAPADNGAGNQGWAKARRATGMLARQDRSG